MREYTESGVINMDLCPELVYSCIQVCTVVYSSLQYSCVVYSCVQLCTVVYSAVVYSYVRAVVHKC